MFGRAVAKRAVYRSSALYWRARSLGRIHGTSFRIRRPERVRVFKGGRLIIGDGVVFDSGCRIIVHGAAEIGPHTAVGRDCVLICYDALHIGTSTLLAERVSIHAAFHDRHSPRFGRMYNVGSTTISDNCWLGANVVVMPGISIGDNAIIGAGAIVTRSVAAGDVVGGSPARSLRDRGSSVNPILNEGN